MDGAHSIIMGTDNLQNKALKLSLNTGDNGLYIDGIKINTKSSETSARREYNRRRKLGIKPYLHEIKSNTVPADPKSTLDDESERYHISTSRGG